MRNKQSPPQTGLYKIKIKNKSIWEDHDTVCLDISVGQDNHEGEKFRATCEWLGARFDHVIVSVNDTLQRYNYMFAEKINETEAAQKCRRDGHEWLERNIKFLSAMPSYEIRRWDSYLTTPAFKTKHQAVLDYYHTTPGYRDAIADMIKTLWDRSYAGQTAVAFRRAEFIKFSENYLLEEMAVFADMADQGLTHHVYPGTFLDLAQEIDSRISYTRIDFSRNKSASFTKSIKI